MKSGQKIDRQEPYFVYIGFTYAHELSKATSYQNNKNKRRKKSKVRPCVQRRLDKLNKYWGIALK